MKITDQTIELKVKTNLDEAIEKVIHLKSLLQEVKELAASLDVTITIKRAPEHQQEGHAEFQKRVDEQSARSPAALPAVFKNTEELDRA
ncbi:MAG: hypothetical protein ABF904_11615 [Ethanoligenens sp.]